MTPKSEFTQALKDITPLSLGVALYGSAFGLLASQAMMSELEIGVMSSLVFAGASQILAVERLVAGAGAVTAAIAAVAVNLRLLLITASIRQLFIDRPWWQILLGAHFSTDENWALLLSKNADGKDFGYWYLIGGGCSLFLTWVVSTVAGALLASAIPEPKALGIDFAFTAAFIAMARSLYSGSKDIIPWVVALVTVIVLLWLQIMDTSWVVLAGGILGSLTAGVLRRD